MLRTPTFENSEGITVITKMPDGTDQIIPGIEPLVDENDYFTGIVGIYSKNGKLNKTTELFYKKYRDEFRWVYLSSSGPYFASHYKSIFKNYDAVTSLDCGIFPSEKYSNNLNISFSMMARSGPLMDGYFYHNSNLNKCMDYSMLTWIGDNKAKVWKDAYDTAIKLAERGYKGIILTQRGTVYDLRKTKLKKYEESGLVELYQADFSQVELTELMGRAYTGIFTSRLDAFPKHIIETLLSDKTIVISPKLLFGVKTLADLGEDITLVQDFNKNDAIDNITAFIDRTKKGITVSPRNEWLKRYDARSLSYIWAKEINRVFKTSYKKVYLMRYIRRFKGIV